MDVEVEARDGPLAASLEEPTGARKGALVLLHGFASTRAEFMDAPRRLAERGYATLAIDSRAHGARATREGRVRAEAVVEDLAAAARDLAERKLADRGIGLVGHSMGGALACLALPRLPAYGAAALVAPLATVRAEIGAAEFLGYRIGDALSRGRTRLGLGPLVVPYRNRYEDLFLDPAAARRAKGLGYLADEVSLASYDELLAVDGVRWARDVRTPTLVVVCTRDAAVKPSSSRRVHAALAGPKELAEIESGHSAFGDRASEALLDRLDRWFAARLT